MWSSYCICIYAKLDLSRESIEVYGVQTCGQLLQRYITMFTYDRV